MQHSQVHDGNTPIVDRDGDDEVVYEYSEEEDHTILDQQIPSDSTRSDNIRQPSTVVIEENKQYLIMSTEELTTIHLLQDKEEIMLQDNISDNNVNWSDYPNDSYSYTSSDVYPVNQDNYDHDIYIMNLGDIHPVFVKHCEVGQYIKVPNWLYGKSKGVRRKYCPSKEEYDDDYFGQYKHKVQWMKPLLTYVSSRLSSLSEKDEPAFQPTKKARVIPEQDVPDP